jgi:hypothetical protein
VSDRQLGVAFSKQARNVGRYERGRAEGLRRHGRPPLLCRDNCRVMFAGPSASISGGANLGPARAGVLQQSGSGAGGSAGGKRAADAAPDAAHETAGEAEKWPRGSAPAAAREPGGGGGAPMQRLPMEREAVGIGAVSTFSAERDVVCVLRLPGNYADEKEFQKVNTEVEAVRSSLLINIKQSPEGQGIIQGTPSGLKWVETGDVPLTGEMLDNQQLKEALSRKPGSPVRARTFTQSE